MNDTKQETRLCKISEKYIPSNLAQNRKFPNNNGRMYYTKAYNIIYKIHSIR